MIRKISFFIAILLIATNLPAQQENVPIDHDVYIFLKEMKVKNVIGPIHDDNPAMSRMEVRKFLEEIGAKINELSATEKKILKKYQNEFYDDKAGASNTFEIFRGDSTFSTDAGDLLSDKIKYTYANRTDGANAYLNILGRAVHGQNFSPFIDNSELFDIGFRFRGTLLDKLGYDFAFIKGGIKGSNGYAATIDPRLTYNFKYVENTENIGNYDFTEGYLRYYTELNKNMNLAVELGREKMSFGYGYSGKLILSADHPDFDFFKIDFKYGIFSFTSWQASTVGVFSRIRDSNYTKYIATNQGKLSFKNLFDLAIGESIIYSGRGLDLAYVNPFIFYKFVEMSLQDRDNAAAWIEMETHFIKNLEFQGTFFIDDDPFGNLSDLNNFINKTGYQLAMFWYTPFGISDLSFVAEYTRIRPYVYSHYNPEDTYTSWNQILGQSIGPNSDQIYTRLAYNFNEWIRAEIDYAHIRHGDNIYDAQGQLVFNAGGDPFVSHRDNDDPVDIKFLDGERINTDIYSIDLRFEPVRQLFFDFVYKETLRRDVIRDTSSDSGYGYLMMRFVL